MMIHVNGHHFSLVWLFLLLGMEGLNDQFIDSQISWSLLETDHLYGRCMHTHIEGVLK